jgi:hypothetical protein
MSLLRSLGVVALLLASVASAACASSADAEPSADPESDENDVRAATTTLSFALVGREFDERAEEWRDVPLDSLNPALQRAGLPAFDKWITLGRGHGAKFTALEAKLEAANKKLRRKIELPSNWDPSGYVGLCFNGIPAGVMKTVDELRGSMFSTDMGVQAYRYRNTKKVFHSTEGEWFKMHREEGGEDHEAELKVWERFETSAAAFLMMVDGGQQGDGTEFFPVLIKACK